MIFPVQSLSNREVSTPFYHLTGVPWFCGCHASVRVNFLLEVFTVFEITP